MIKRPNWVRRLEQAWEQRPIIWLSGVRRVGKTTLSRMIPDVRHLNCLCIFIDCGRFGLLGPCVV